MNSILLREIVIKIFTPFKESNVTEKSKKIGIYLLNSVKHSNSKDNLNFGKVYLSNGNLTLKGYYKIDENLVDNVINAL